VISDYKNPENTVPPITAWRYLADVKNISNMYPYGKLYGTNAIYNASEDYRYGFNGMEKEKNMDASGDITDFGARVFDANSPVFLSRDPLEGEFPYQSAYVFAGNTPIQAIDENGTRIRNVHVWSVNFDKGEYTVEHNGTYKREDGKSPKGSTGTDENSYYFKGEVFDDLYKVPGYQFAFDKKVNPMWNKIWNGLELGVSILVAGLTRGKARGGGILNKYIFANAIYSVSVKTIETIENTRDKFPSNLGGVVGLTLDITIGNETKSIQGYLEVGDDLLMWRPYKIEGLDNLEKLSYGISLYNVIDKVSADKFLENLKSDYQKLLEKLNKDTKSGANEDDKKTSKKANG
jgi:RHS repeat-associated protein